MVRENIRGKEVLRPPKDTEDFLTLTRTEDEARRIADIHYVPLMNKDSTNMVPDDWTTIASAINDRMNDGFDGFVVAHGTDTMHFTSSALAFAFGPNLNLPIVLTGAQTIPDVPYGDARVNLLRALKVAGEDLAEVVVAFGEAIFRGCRVQKKDEKRFDAFESPAEFPLGYITEEILLSGFAARRKAHPGIIDFRPGFADGVVQISLIPGLRPESLFPLLDPQTCNGIVLQSFGAGNVPNDGVYSFRDFIRQAVKLGLPVVIASQFPANATFASSYEPGVEAIDEGAIPTGNMTNAAATVKFRWVLCQALAAGLVGTAKLDFIRGEMDRSYVGEMTESRQSKSV
jgi:L-asparaginase type I